MIYAVIIWEVYRLCSRIPIRIGRYRTFRYLNISGVLVKCVSASNNCRKMRLWQVYLSQTHFHYFHRRTVTASRNPHTRYWPGTRQTTRHGGGREEGKQSPSSSPSSTGSAQTQTCGRHYQKKVALAAYTVAVSKDELFMNDAIHTADRFRPCATPNHNPNPNPNPTDRFRPCATPNHNPNPNPNPKT